MGRDSILFDGFTFGSDQVKLDLNAPASVQFHIINVSFRGAASMRRLFYESESGVFSVQGMFHYTVMGSSKLS